MFFSVVGIVLWSGTDQDNVE